MAKLKILIADDSQLIQTVLADIFSSDKELEVVGIAKNGQEAWEKVQLLRPDIVTVDIQMPVMDGLEAIECIMAECAIPILVISDVSESAAAFTALANGALDVISKSYIHAEKAAELICKVKLLSKVKVIRHIRKKTLTRVGSKKNPLPFNQSGFKKVLAIACSTGGPKALSLILKALPPDFPCPILIAQHIEDGFVDGLVEWIDNVSIFKVKCGEEGESVKSGEAFISPTSKHMVIGNRGKVKLVDRHPGDIYHPSCNKLLTSAALVFKEKCIGVILSGMGNDGVEGMKEIKRNGGITIAQDEASSVVFGMPKEAIKSGCIDRVLPLHEISKSIVRIVNQST